jgi:hypothetical protein
MKKKFYIILAIITLSTLISSCSNDSIQGNKIKLDDLINNLTPNNNNDENAKSNNKGISLDTIMSITNEIPDSRDELGNMRTVVKIYNGSDNAGISIPGFGGIKLGKDETNLNVYYIETKVINKAKDSIVYGIGYSAHYLFKKIKKGLDVSNLPYIAASVQLESNKTQVFYSLQTYGVKGINLVRYFKPTVNKNFDVEGFGLMQSSIDGIHNVLGDSTLSESVKFTPEILKFVKPYELNQ